MATISHTLTSPDPIYVAITCHRTAYDAFQAAPEGAPSYAAFDAYNTACAALVGTPCATRFGALALLTHLRWWMGEEAEFRADYEPAYSLAEVRASDLTLFLGSPLAPAVGRSVDVLAGSLPLAAPSGRLGRPLPACDGYHQSAPSAPRNEAMPGEAEDAVFIAAARPDTAHVRASRLLTLSGEVLTGLFLICAGAVLTGYASLL